LLEKGSILKGGVQKDYAESQNIGKPPEKEVSWWDILKEGTKWEGRFWIL